MVPILAAAHAFQMGRGEEPPTPTRHQSFCAPPTCDSVEHGAGVRPVDVRPARSGVRVVNQSGGNRHRCRARDRDGADAPAQTSRTTGHAPRDGMNRSLHRNEAYGKTIGIVGLGNVGSRGKEICRDCSPSGAAYDHPSAEEVARRGARKVDSIC